MRRDGEASPDSGSSPDTDGESETMAELQGIALAELAADKAAAQTLPASEEPASEEPADMMVWPPGMPQEVREPIETRLQDACQFRPVVCPHLLVHPGSKTADNALYLLMCCHLRRTRASSRGMTYNDIKNDMIVTSHGAEFVVCGFVLAHATSATAMNLFQDGFAQASLKEWIAILFNADAAGLTLEVRSPTLPHTDVYTPTLPLTYVVWCSCSWCTTW
jgi:hypothetical protein